MSASLPREVRARVVALAADRLGGLAEEQVPAAVRPFRRFTPRRRAQAAAAPLAAAIEQDAVFRQLVSEAVPEPLAAAVRSGTAPPAAPPEEVACAAYLLRPDGWEAVVEAVAAELAERDRLAAGAATVDEVRRLTEQLEALRTAGREEAERLTAERDAARAEAAAAVRRARDAGSRAAAAERALAALADVRAAAPPPETTGADLPADGPAAADAAEVRRLRSRLRAAEEGLASARAAARGERREEQVRLRVLLDAVVGAASGLQRELGLPPLDERPADAVAATFAGPASASGAAAQGRSDDDPALLDALLCAPAVHLLVDGYNVTKTGYGEQSLEVQRGRLLARARGARRAHRRRDDRGLRRRGARGRSRAGDRGAARGPAAVQRAGGDGRRRPAPPRAGRAAGPADGGRLERPRGGGRRAPGRRAARPQPGAPGAGRALALTAGGAQRRFRRTPLLASPAPVLDRRRPPWRPLCSSTATGAPCATWPAPTAS